MATQVTSWGEERQAASVEDSWEEANMTEPLAEVK